MTLQPPNVLRSFYETSGLLTDKERDACGFGFIVSTKGPSPDVISSALKALGNMAHRGVTMADGLTGDGAGIKVQLPENFIDFIEEKSKAEGFHVPTALVQNRHVAVGQFFLSPAKKDSLKELAETRIREYLQSKNYKQTDYLWRKVPVNLQYLGRSAQESQPAFEQLILPSTSSDQNAELDLYKLRLRIEQDWRDAGYNKTSSQDAYIPSLSSTGLVYKGMPLAENVANLFPDLNHSIFENIAWAQFHQRFSTNTTSTADKAHPYRFVVHNGEINTLTANKIFGSEVAAEKLRHMMGDTWKGNVFQPGGSDTAGFDNFLELLVMSGMSLPSALATMVTGAYGNDAAKHDTILKASRKITLPWDGPAAMAAIAGDYAVVIRDRNGFRPARGLVTKSGLIIVGSENGMVSIEPQDIERYLPLDPGGKFAINLKTGETLDAAKVESLVAHELEPLAEKITAQEKNFVFTPSLPSPRPLSEEKRRELFYRQARAHYTSESMDRILAPLVTEGKEATWAMGDDAQLAVLAQNIALDPFYGLMRQAFAQVTNPPMDSLNEGERMVTKDPDGHHSLNMPIGNLGAPLRSPILFSSELQALQSDHPGKFASLSAVYRSEVGEDALRVALRQLQQDAEDQVRAGKTQIVLSHQESDGVSSLAIPMPLAISAVHNRLVSLGMRNDVALHAHTQELIETHKTAMLIASGANFVTPYLVEDTIADSVNFGSFSNSVIDTDKAFSNYRHAVDSGYKKIIAKMGISVPSAFWGQFSLLGLNSDDAAEFFPGISSPISGLTLENFQRRQQRHAELASEVIESGEIRGVQELARGESLRNLKPVTDLERELHEIHTWSPEVIQKLQAAAISGSQKAYDELVEHLETSRAENPVNLRDLIKLKFSPEDAVPLDKVQGSEFVLDRMNAPGISLGAIAPWVHRDIAIALRNLRKKSQTGEGPKSNSGEGGEDSVVRRFQDASSTVKQVASGRFGVDALYLADAEVIEIKVAQGAKPGEGGQLMGPKVQGLVAELRRATPGVSLVSPPPHHDIYSIEDLAQLIADLKAVNPDARVRVKLVSQPGIGQIAVGVAKTRADEIQISGHSGGTAASPLSSVKHAGNPVEIGLAEVHQALQANGLRQQTRLIADGGVITGLDSVKLKILGADEVGAGTAGLVALGCVMTRKCHDNNCPAGVATQNADLESYYHGKPEYLENYYSLIANEERVILAKLGITRDADIVGRTDLLEQIPHDSGIDLGRLLATPPEAQGIATGSKIGSRQEPPQTLDQKLGAKAIVERMVQGEAITIDTRIDATNLSVGAYFAGEIARQYVLNAIDTCKNTLPRNPHGEIEPSVLQEAIKRFEVRWP